jgi:phage gp16-like protein
MVASNTDVTVAERKAEFAIEKSGAFVINGRANSGGEGAVTRRRHYCAKRVIKQRSGCNNPARRRRAKRQTGCI